MQSNAVNTDTEGAILSVCIKRVEFRENVKAFFPLGQSKLPVIIRAIYTRKNRRVLHRTRLK